MEIAKIKFAVILGQVWFKEFSTMDEDSMVIPWKDYQVACKVEMKEVKVDI
jgi:hypothetical protein